MMRPDSSMLCDAVPGTFLVVSVVKKELIIAVSGDVTL